MLEPSEAFYTKMHFFVNKHYIFLKMQTCALSFSFVWTKDVGCLDKKEIKQKIKSTIHRLWWNVLKKQPEIVMPV